MSLFARAILTLVFFIHTLKGQVNLSTNLLKTIPVNRPLIFEVRIEKLNTGSFSRFQLDVPPGVSIQEMDSRTGSFSVEGNKVKLIWVTTPPESEFVIRLKLIPLKTPDQGTFRFSYFYVQDNVKKEWSSGDYTVRFRDTILPVLMSAPMVRLTNEFDPLPPAPPVATATNTSGKTADELRQQVAQLRKDAGEAKTVGMREKRKAANKLTRAEEEEKTWLARPPGTRKDAELQRIGKDREKAAEELLVAERVLVLSATLNKNADEIEEINRRMHPEAFGAVKTTPPTSVEPGAKVISTVDYRVQVGAFRTPPAKNAFRGMGKVFVEKEGETYKVMVGEFAEKADAYALRDKLKTKYPGCFVVKFDKGKKAD